eukprot:g15358.t1
MDPGSSSHSEAHARSGSSSSNSRARERDGAASEMMHMSIDSQSFVNLGQLMGSRHGTTGGGGSNSNSSAPCPGRLIDDLGESCLSGEDDDDSEGLRDFDQIFHPRAEQGGSTSSVWSGRALYGRRGSGTDDDDDESLLPALPSRSTTPGSPRGADPGSSKKEEADEPGWDEEDFESDSMSEGGGVRGGRVGGRGQGFSSGLCIDLTAANAADTSKVAAVMTPETQRASLDADDVEDSNTTVTAAAATAGVQGGEATATTPLALLDSWLHVPLGDDDTAVGEAVSDSRATNADVDDGPAGDAARIDPHQQRYYDAAAAAARARHAAAVALADCGECLVHVVDKASALAASRLQQAARVVRELVEAGADACARGQQVVVKAVDNVPQAPVRMWLIRIAGSLFIGAVLGGAAAYLALPRAMTMTSPASPCDAGAADTTSPWWDTGRGSGAGAGEPGEGAEQSFGDRLNKALFAARAGEAAAQQVLLEEVRNILAATGKSGGISAEQILRQFNAKRFKEASKAWSAAEGGSSSTGGSASSSSAAGLDPLDSVFFAPPSTPTTPPTNPSTSPPPSDTSTTTSSSSSQHQPQQQPFIPEGAAPATECAGGASGSAFCSPDAAGGDVGAHIFAARAKAQQYRRPCPGGWVC